MKIENIAKFIGCSVDDARKLIEQLKAEPIPGLVDNYPTGWVQVCKSLLKEKK